jgi:biotin operon repressor
MEKNISEDIKDTSSDEKMLWETIGKPAYERGLLEGRQESGLFAIIPMSILEDKTLSANAKLLYGEIMALSKKSGKCYATNEYLADVLGLSKTSLPQIIRELAGCGLIVVDIQRSKKGTYRDITVSFFNKGGHSSLTMGGIVKEQGQKRNRQIEIDKESKMKATVSVAKKDSNNIFKIDTKPVQVDEQHNHILPKGREKVSYGNQDINDLILLLKEKNYGLIDGSERENRQYCWVLLKKLGYSKDKEKAKNGVITIIEFAIKSHFHAKNATNFKYLFRHAAAIIADYEEKQKVEKKSKFVFI